MNSQATPLVVGVDGTERSRNALAPAAQLADSDQRGLLTHVHPYGRLANLLSDPQYELLVRDVADATVRGGAEDTGACRSARAVPGVELVAGGGRTADRGGDRRLDHRRRLLTSLRARPRARRQRHGIGAHRCPVPVAVAPRGYSGTDRALRTIGCGYDGSPESPLALAWAADLARRRGADLLALAVHTPVAFGGASTGSAFGHKSANDALRAALVEQLNDAVTALGNRNEISGRVLVGDAASELAEASAERDLLVLGSRGYGPVRSVLLGSLSRALARSAACPVVVVPRPERTPSD